MVVAIYTQLSQYKNYFISELTKILDKYRGSYEGTVILDDFNMQPTNQILETCLKVNNFVNLIKFNTSYKSKPGSYTDLILKAISNKSFEPNSLLQDVEQPTKKKKVIQN